MRTSICFVATIIVVACVFSNVAARLACAAGQDPNVPAGDRRGPPGPPPGRGFEMPRLPLMSALDVNGDGELSAEELAGAAQALKKLDKNGDSKLSREELQPAFGGRRGPEGPGGRTGAGPGGPGGRTDAGPGGRQAAQMQTPPRAKDDAEGKILDVLNDMDRNQRRGMMNVPVEDGRFLRMLAESLDAKTIVEIGTSNGYSGIWFCLALRQTGGRLITHDIDEGRFNLAKQNFAKAGVSQLVTQVLGNAHETITRLKGPVDLVFIDADKEGYPDYLQKTLPLVRPGGLIVAHNMNPRMAAQDFLKAITTNPDLETVFYMEGGGIAVTLKKR